MSGDVMQFPKTVEEFMEKYKVVDTEQVYTNGAELVPIFRMEQWFEHLRHGKWIWHKIPGYYFCSECGFCAAGNTLECMDGTFKFCPVCGAKMDEVEG